MLNNLTSQISNLLAIGGIKPMKPTYIFVNADDNNYQFGYENLEEAKKEDLSIDDFFQGFVLLDGEQIPVYVY